MTQAYLPLIKRHARETFALCGPDGEVVWVGADGGVLPTTHKLQMTTQKIDPVTGRAVPRSSSPKRASKRSTELQILSLKEVQPFIRDYLPPLSFDERGQQIYMGDDVLEDPELGALHQRIAEKYSRLINASETRAAVTAMAHRNTFDPALRLINSLPSGTRPADAKKWISDVLSLSEDWESELWLRWGVAAIARLTQPGELVKFIPVLVGHRDHRKSSFVQALGMGLTGEAPLDQNHRDTAITMRSKWIWELPELETMTRQWGWDRVKAWVATREDSWTPKRANYPVTRKRNWICIGTTNCEDFLRDPNAATRFPFFRIDKPIDTEKVEKGAAAFWACCRDLQLDGYKSYLDGPLESLVSLRGEAFSPADPMLDKIDSFLVEEGLWEVDALTIAHRVFGLVGSEWDKAMGIRVSKYMNELPGWTKALTRPRVQSPWDPAKKVKTNRWVKTA